MNLTNVRNATLSSTFSRSFTSKKQSVPFQLILKSGGLTEPASEGSSRPNAPLRQELSKSDLAASFHAKGKQRSADIEFSPPRARIRVVLSAPPQQGNPKICAHQNARCVTAGQPCLSCVVAGAGRRNSSLKTTRKRQAA
jgi:hypothetical protein